MKIDSHSGVGRYPVFVPTYAGMTSWIPDRVRNDMRHFHASLCLNRPMAVSGQLFCAEDLMPFGLLVMLYQATAARDQRVRRCMHDMPFSLLPHYLLDLAYLFLNFPGFVFIGTFSLQL